MLLDTPFLVVVLRIVGASLSIHLSLQASFFAGIGCEFLTEGDKISFAFAWNNSQSGRANIQADDIRTRLLMLWLDKGIAL
jgi:hypothetical protein